MRRDSKISASFSLIGHPVVAAALGVLLGVLLMLVSYRASRFVTPENPTAGVIVVMLITGARFAVAIAALAAFYLFARDGLAPFSVALALSFVASLGFEAVKVLRPHSIRTSA